MLLYPAVQSQVCIYGNTNQYSKIPCCFQTQNQLTYQQFTEDSSLLNSKQPVPVAMPLTTPEFGCSVCRRAGLRVVEQRKFQANQSHMGRPCQKKEKKKKWPNHVTDCSRSKFTPQSTPKKGRLAFLMVLKSVQTVGQVSTQCESLFCSVLVSSVNTQASTGGLWMYSKGHRTKQVRWSDRHSGHLI